jgi:hypothetical protein
VLIEAHPEVAESPAKRKPHNRWHAVIIAAPADACAAAKECRGKRFLSAEAPWLPLEGCDVARCQCKYRHHADRRGAPRRKTEKGAAPAAKAKDQGTRRTSRGRRAAD